MKKLSILVLAIALAASFTLAAQEKAATPAPAPAVTAPATGPAASTAMTAAETDKTVIGTISRYKAANAAKKTEAWLSLKVAGKIEAFYVPATVQVKTPDGKMESPAMLKSGTKVSVIYIEKGKSREAREINLTK